MRFLCLHGMGTNQSVLATQLASMQANLSEQHEYVFVEGELDCVAAKGVAEFFPSPYLCYYDLPTPELVKDAHELVLEVIEEEGPFDGVIGFSQGAALASSLILRQTNLHPGKDLFGMAVFLCASLPFDVDAPPAPISAALVDEMAACGYSGEPAEGQKLLQRYRPSDANIRKMDIPTVHVVGRADEYFEQGVRLGELGGTRARVLEHDGGHEVPKTRMFSLKLARAVQEAINQVRYKM